MLCPSVHIVINRNDIERDELKDDIYTNISLISVVIFNKRVYPKKISGEQKILVSQIVL